MVVAAVGARVVRLHRPPSDEVVAKAAAVEVEAVGPACWETAARNSCLKHGADVKTSAQGGAGGVGTLQGLNMVTALLCQNQSVVGVDGSNDYRRNFRAVGG